MLQERIEGLPDTGLQHLRSAQIRALAEAGMAIEFHTLGHPLLSLLPDSALDDAVARGRIELERAAGRPLSLALRSAVGQRAVNLEVIVVDDGSQDHTCEMVSRPGDLRVHPGNMSRDMAGRFREVDILARRHGIPVDRARHYRAPGSPRLRSRGKQFAPATGIP